jgi:hypothetical protein
MSVYVDNLVNYGWKYGKSCHLIADTRAELMAFAMAMGMKANWYQPGSFPHFDLTEGRRAAAVARGAIQLDRRDYVYKMWALRDTPEYADVKGIRLTAVEGKAELDI